MASKSKYQYEPLITPRNWREDEKRFALRLTQILDDVYAKLGKKDGNVSSGNRDLYDEINGRIDVIEKTKLDSDQGLQNAGKLLYVSGDGTVIPLSIGSGLAIYNGMLTLTSEIVLTAICGSAMCGKAICGGSK